MTLRQSTLDDLAFVSALLARSYPRLLAADYPASILEKALPFMICAQPSLLESGSYYVWDGQERLLAAGGWSRDAYVSDKAHIRHVVTDYMHVRRGIARLLISHALEAARDAGVRDMECWSTFTAVPFYEALGFQSLGPIEVPMGEGVPFPAIRMTQSL